ALAVGGTLPGAVAQQTAWNKAAFEAKRLADVVKALGGSTAVPSKDIVITAPDIAENGAAVSVGIASKIPNTQNIYIVVEKNATALVAAFNIPPGTEPRVDTRIKMAESAPVYAVVRANNQFFVASRDVKVTMGGCGG
ncbi:MAG: thiosulfate oxidation carrier protein SoxY, partial [Burkholderiaceae bacterium]|nr:thiosulfate oxidation carrier protein SoxY [Burkholderiaceae bacterium]